MEKGIRGCLVLLAGFLLTAATVSAQVVITEIAYDLEGTDTGYEWIEVQNDGGSSVDLSQWKFREGGVNHGLVPEGSATLSAGAYAVIADDPTKFRSANSGFSGRLFDSSFSLNNTGEELALLDGTGTEQFSVTYISDWGASGDGNTLNRVNGSWVAREPSPGAPASGGVSQQESEDEDNQNVSTGSALTGSVFLAPVYSAPNDSKKEEEEGQIYDPHLVVEVEGPTDVMVGTVATFQGKAQSSTTGNNKPNTRFSWNFGDGSTGRGTEVEHVYRYPGVYTVYLEGAEGHLEGEAMLEVTVHASDMTLTPLSFGSEAGLQMGNNTELLVDLSGWSIDVDSWRYVFPAGTRIAPSQSAVVTIPGARIYESSSITLFSEGGRRVSSWKKEPVQVAHASRSYSPEQSSITKVSVEGEVEKVEEEVAGINARLAASVVDSAEEVPRTGGGAQRENSWLVWMLGVLGLVVVGMAALLIVKRTASIDPIDEYKILEE